MACTPEGSQPTSSPFLLPQQVIYGSVSPFPCLGPEQASLPLRAAVTMAVFKARGSRAL